MFRHFLSPQPMHAPDGVFAVWLAIIGWVIMLAMVALAVRNTHDRLGEKQVPLMGLLAAAIFAGQMINFTIPGGTSGHLLGGALAAIILGPWGGMLVMTAVVIIQALVFQDGGLLVLGLNVINMGIVTSFVGYFVYRLLHRIFKGKIGMLVSAFIGAWLSLVVTAAFAAVELALSGTSPLVFGLPAMVGIHVLIGIGEGLLTVFALSFILAARPDLVGGEQSPGQSSARWVLVGLVLALAITLAAPFASPYQDGMERIFAVFANPDAVDETPVGFAVPEEQQFFGEVQDSPVGLFPDYTLPFLGKGGLSTVAAGMIGVLIVFGVAYGAAWLSKRLQKKPDVTPPA